MAGWSSAGDSEVAGLVGGGLTRVGRQADMVVRSVNGGLGAESGTGLAVGKAA